MAKRSLHSTLMFVEGQKWQTRGQGTRVNVIALVLVACLPHTGQCKSIVQHPAPKTHDECQARAAKLQRTLTGTTDDAGYRPIQVTCMYADPEKDGE